MECCAEKSLESHYKVGELMAMPAALILQDIHWLHYNTSALSHRACMSSEGLSPCRTYSIPLFHFMHHHYSKSGVFADNISGHSAGAMLGM